MRAEEEKKKRGGSAGNALVGVAGKRNQFSIASHSASTDVKIRCSFVFRSDESVQGSRFSQSTEESYYIAQNRTKKKK